MLTQDLEGTWYLFSYTVFFISMIKLYVNIRKTFEKRECKNILKHLRLEKRFAFKSYQTWIFAGLFERFVKVYVPSYVGLFVYFVCWFVCYFVVCKLADYISWFIYFFWFFFFFLVNVSLTHCLTLLKFVCIWWLFILH